MSGGRGRIFGDGRGDIRHSWDMTNGNQRDVVSSYMRNSQLSMRQYETQTALGNQGKARALLSTARFINNLLLLQYEHGACIFCFCVAQRWCWPSLLATLSGMLSMAAREATVLSGREKFE